MDQPRRSTFTLIRFAIPIVILLITAALLAAMWLRPGVPLGSKAPNTFFLSIAAIGALWLWAVLLSGAKWYIRVPILLAGVAAGLGFVGLAMTGHLVFDGDMVPSMRSPFEGHADAVEAERQQQGPPPSTPVEISDRPTDWPEFRGPKRDGVVVRGPKLSRDWKAKPPKQVWKQLCGEGWSSFAVAGNLVVTIEQRRDNEAIIAYDAATGRERWKHEYKARFFEVLGGVGPRATPTISEGEVFSLGGMGHLVCLDALSGSQKWMVNILEGGSNLMWGMAGSPLVVDGKVIVNPGKQTTTDAERGLVAYDRKTGKQVWASPGFKAGYASPMLATFLGEQQIVLLDGEQVAGFHIPTGGRIWTYPWRDTNQDINVAQPLVLDDNRVFISSGYGVGCAMLKIDREGEVWNAKPIYRKENKPLRCKMSGPVEYQGHIYGLDEGILACIDAATGEEKWRDGRYGHGQLLRFEDLLIILDERGNLVLVEATPLAHRELGKVKAIKAERTWNVPAMVDGRIFVRNDREMACFDLRE